MSINVPASVDATDGTPALVDSLRNQLGLLPNLYSALAHSTTALPRCIALRGPDNSLTAREHSVIALGIAQVNDCLYVLSEQTARARDNGFSDGEIMELRHGCASFDNRLDALARLAHNIAIERGFADSPLMDAFAAAGYRQENLVDMMLSIGAMTINSYFANATQPSIDFPLAPRDVAVRR